MEVFATCAWSATSNVSWIVINAGFGSGNGYVILTLATNSSGTSRSGQINVSGVTFTVNQLGGAVGLTCSYALSTTSQIFSREGGSSSLLVSTTDGCEWTTVNTAAWIKVTAGLAGSGEGVVGITADPNTTGQTRQALLRIGGNTMRVLQAP